jgi:urease gamma subunit
MIHIRSLVKGEPDTDPLTQIFDYTNHSDEQIFYNSIEIIKNKLDRNLKININESLFIFCAYIVENVRDNIPVRIIEKNAQKILNANKVTIGVPESLRKITFEVRIDHLPERVIIFEKPISTSNYMLASEK